MTAPDIRAQAIEVLARSQRVQDLADYTHLSDGSARADWDGLSERMRDCYRRYAEPHVAALAEAGLLPTPPDAYAVLSKRTPDDSTWLSGPWDSEATVFVDRDAADGSKVNWEVDLIECGRNPDVFVLAEIRVIP